MAATRQMRAGNARWPPGPGLAAIPSILAGRARDPLALLERMRDAHGGVVHLGVAGRHVVLVSDPEVAHRLLVTEATNVRKWRVGGEERVVFGDGLLTSDGELWRRQRRLLQPAFARERIAGYARVVARHAAARADGWHDGQVVDVLTEMTAITTLVVGEVLLGTDLEAELDRIRLAVTEVMEFFMLLQPPFGALRARLPTRRVRAFVRARTDLDALVARMIAARRAADAPGEDMIGMLLAARDAGGAPLPDALIRDEVLTMLGAGLETTAGALAFAWWELATVPGLGARLEGEADAWDGTPDPSRLPVAAAVFEETLRLHPPAWILARRATEAVDAGAWRVPAGTVLLVCPYLMHRDARWWPDPARFDIDRPAPPDPRAAMPFGAGPRKCIGTHLARTEGPLVLAAVARRVRLHPAGPAPAHRAMVTLRPDSGPRMRVERRSSPGTPAAERSTF